MTDYGFALGPLEAVARREHMDVRLGDDFAGGDVAAGSDGAFELFFRGPHAAVDVEVFGSEPAFGDAYVAHHAVHAVGAERSRLVGAFHAPVDRDVLLDDFCAHSDGNRRGGDADGVVGEAYCVLSVVFFEVGDCEEVEVVGVGYCDTQWSIEMSEW